MKISFDNMDNLIARFQAVVKERQLFGRRDRLLVAVSGGLDSAVLADCCYRSGYDFSIAHVNFQLRAADSERDEQFVRAMADRYAKPFRVIKFDTQEYAGSRGISIQVAARALRYQWFEELMEAEQYQCVLTAHHLDDNIETMLMHFFRGTGIAGLRGMLPRQGKIVRPFLGFSRSELAGFAKAQSLSWVEDGSNASDKYTRNYFRNKLLPDAETVFPEVRHNLRENLQRFAETETLYREAVELHKKKLMKPAGAEIHLPVMMLKKTHPLRSILYEILNPYGFSTGQLDDAIGLLDAENGKYISSNSHRLIRNRAWLILAPSSENASDLVLIGARTRETTFGGGMLLFKTSLAEKSKTLPADPAAALLDAGKISFPLILRKWKAGDYFYPLGMKKKKKVARFLIDQKLSKTAKEKIWVLESGQRIVWIVGQRIDDRFSVGPATRDILNIVFRVPQFI